VEALILLRLEPLQTELRTRIGDDRVLIAAAAGRVVTDDPGIGQQHVAVARGRPDLEGDRRLLVHVEVEEGDVEVARYVGLVGMFVIDVRAVDLDCAVVAGRICPSGGDRASDHEGAGQCGRRRNTGEPATVHTDYSNRCRFGQMVEMLGSPAPRARNR
jgi:hypothetical protein